MLLTHIFSNCQTYLHVKKGQLLPGAEITGCQILNYLISTIDIKIMVFNKGENLKKK